MLCKSLLCPWIRYSEVRLYMGRKCHWGHTGMASVVLASGAHGRYFFSFLFLSFFFCTAYTVRISESSLLRDHNSGWLVQTTYVACLFASQVPLSDIFFFFFLCGHLVEPKIYGCVLISMSIQAEKIPTQVYWNLRRSATLWDTTASQFDHCIYSCGGVVPKRIKRHEGRLLLWTMEHSLNEWKHQLLSLRNCFLLILALLKLFPTVFDWVISHSCVTEHWTLNRDTKQKNMLDCNS